MDERFVKGGPLPNSMGAAADLYSDVRDLRLRMQKAVDEVKARETEIHNYMLTTLAESVDTGASGERFRVQLVRKQRAAVKDWQSFYAYVRQTGAFELMQRRLADVAVREHLDQGVVLPGVEMDDYDALSVTKI